MNDFELMVDTYTIKTNNKIKRFCEPLKQHFSINYFWYYQITDKGRYHCFGSHAPWMEHYYAQKLYLKNPYLRHPSNYSSGVSLIRKVKDPDFQESIELGKNLFDVNLSLVLMQKSGHGLQGFGFASSLETELAENMYLAELPLLQFFAKRFCEEFDHLIKTSKDDHVDLASAMGKSFFAKKSVAFQKNGFMKSMGLCDYTRLSEREKEVLLLIGEGYSASQVASSLSISNRTSEYYIENIKNKLNCFSRQELVQRGQDLALLGSW